MNKLQIFNNEQFGQMRTITENGNTLFCGSDVAKALGYAKPQNAIEAHCRCALKRGIPHPQAPDKKIEMSFIPEGDVYRLITHSKLPAAEKFERWVFDEVLPSVRQTGAYMTPETIEKVLLNPDTIINLATQIKELQAKIQANAPKVLFSDAVSTSQNSILVGDLAKLVRQNGVNIGQKRLFQWLRDNKYLCKNNMPTQRAMDMDLFEVKESTIANPDGSVRTTFTTKVTGKGQIYFVNKLLA